MLLEIFCAVIFIGILFVFLSLMTGEEWLLHTGFGLWFIGLCGVIIVALFSERLEEREPCRCEVCCGHETKFAGQRESNYREIPKSEAVVGDYAYTDGDSGFCHGSYNKIVGITTNYHPRTGKPFKVVVLDDEDVYRFDNGRCIEGAEAYRIISYARLKPGVVIKSDE